MAGAWFGFEKKVPAARLLRLSMLQGPLQALHLPTDLWQACAEARTNKTRSRRCVCVCVCGVCVCVFFFFGGGAGEFQGSLGFAFLWARSSFVPRFSLLYG